MFPPVSLIPWEMSLYFSLEISVRRDFALPLEVKATNGRAKSLRTLIASEKYGDISHGIKLTGGNVGYSDNIYTFPYFCAFLLKRYLKSGNSAV